MERIISSQWLIAILKEYPNHRVVFSPIRHSEYTVEFHMKKGVWSYQGDELLYSLVDYIDSIPEYDQIGRSMCNGYANDAEDPTWLVTAAVWMRYDNVLVIMG